MQKTATFFNFNRKSTTYAAPVYSRSYLPGFFANPLTERVSAIASTYPQTL